MTSRKEFHTYCFWLLGTCLVSVILAASLVFLVDPLQVYRASRYQPRFTGQERYEWPGVAKHYDYNAVLVGTSMTQNFSMKYIDERLGTKILRLSISGSSAHEQSMLLKVAIDTGKVKTVLWGADFGSFRGKPDRVRDEQGGFPWFLYGNNQLAVVSSYLLNKDFIEDSVAAAPEYFFGSSRNGGRESLEEVNTWYAKARFGADAAIKSYEKEMSEDPYRGDEFDFEKMKRNLDLNLVSLIKAHPEIQFRVFFTPGSILEYKYLSLCNPSMLESVIAFKRYAYKVFSGLTNAKLYDFDYDFEITTNLANYKDVQHYSRAINNRIVDMMANDFFLVRSGSESWPDGIARMVSSFEVPSTARCAQHTRL